MVYYSSIIIVFNECFVRASADENCKVKMVIEQLEIAIKWHFYQEKHFIRLRFGFHN